uniref:Pept_C1 domain-containing protein n=1 Tax=Panagrellus redivivus TaxID=6233 RepID=A0A7E4UTP1_PANRE
MAKVFSAQTQKAQFTPLTFDPVYGYSQVRSEQPNRPTSMERATRFWLNVVGIALIVTMTMLIIAQQLLNRDLITENEQLRESLSYRSRPGAIEARKTAEAHPLFDRYSDDFETFKARFEKSYETPEEEHRRMVVFLNRMAEIDQLNDDIGAVEASTEFGPNEFADMTDEEIQKLLLPIDYYRRLHESATFIQPQGDTVSETAVKPPPRLDWREKGVVTAVKAQGKCGSCWAFATAATVESAYAVAHGELRNLSEQELLDCNLANNACNGGDLDKSFQFVHENGLVAEDAYPYVAHRQNTCSAASAGETTKIDVAYWLNPSEDAMIDWLVNYGPVNVGIAVPPSMMQYKGGVFKPTDYDCKFKVLGLHALLVVGYGETDEGEKYWIVKNSWGQKWGTENGYVYFARGVNACGIEDEAIGILA